MRKLHRLLIKSAPKLIMGLNALNTSIDMLHHNQQEGPANPNKELKIREASAAASALCNPTKAFFRKGSSLLLLICLKTKKLL